MLEAVQGQAEGVALLSRVVFGHLTLPLLLVGPSGVGRRFSVLEAAKELVKVDGNQAYQIDQGIHPDVTVLTPEPGKDLKVDPVRDLLEKVKFQPSRAPLRWVVVDGIDRATAAASNALLKSLEEPPYSTRFFLLAEDETKVLPTIRSRCAWGRYVRLPESLILNHLSQFTADSTRALVCCRLAGGSIGRAFQILNSDQLSVRDGMLDALAAAVRGDLSSAFSVVDSTTDLQLGISFIEHILHDMSMIETIPSRMSNLDRADFLSQLKTSLGEDRLNRLRKGLRLLQVRCGLPINLAFHTKTLLASAI